MLLDFHAHTSRHWSTGAVVEYRVDEAVLPNGVRIRGAVDRLDPHYPTGYHVVDYKTGNPKNADTQLKPAVADTTLVDWHQNEKARGGNYWRQGIFYHLLLTHDQAESYTPAQVSFQFVQPNEEASSGHEYAPIKVAVTPEAVQAVLAQIQAVDEAIRAQQFSSGCGTCSWCLLRGIE
jgi:DNA helicase-2/ATP-dependent DNA helicase PcrA